MMHQAAWNVTRERGFLIAPDPALHLDDLRLLELREIEAAAADMAWLLQTGRLRPTLDGLPILDLTPLEAHLDALNPAEIQRLMQIYAFFASAYIHAPNETPIHALPAPIAVPLVRLAGWLERPPMLAYADYVLSNWQTLRGDAITLDNTATVQNFIGGRDESWFILTHVDIEARSADALNGLRDAVSAADDGDADALEASLSAIPASLDRMIASFNRMPEGCRPDVYYQQVRPYNFGFKDVLYTGVAHFDGQPQTFRGGSGAQSSVIPALVAGLGIQHETSGLSQHLSAMQAYMPKPHRDFIAAMKRSRVRETIASVGRPTLTDLYNACLAKVLAFRQQHLQYADLYIARHVANPIGTGGTVFME